MCGIVPAIGAIGASKVLFGGGGGGSDDNPAPKPVEPVDAMAPVEPMQAMDGISNTSKEIKPPTLKGPSNTGLQIGGQ